MRSKNLVIVERMNNLGPWEFFRFSDEETDAVICKMALRHDEPQDLVEYGVWRKLEGEPSATGTIEIQADEWDDEAREKTLEAIAEIYRKGLPEVAAGLIFKIAEDDADEEDDDAEDDSEANDEDDDNDADDDDGDSEDDEDDDSDDEDADDEEDES